MARLVTIAFRIEPMGCSLDEVSGAEVSQLAPEGQPAVTTLPRSIGMVTA